MSLRIMHLAAGHSKIMQNVQNPDSSSPDLYLLVELRGIEPLSESLFIAASPIAVIILTFPPPGA